MDNIASTLFKDKKADIAALATYGFTYDKNKNALNYSTALGELGFNLFISILLPPSTDKNALTNIKETPSPFPYTFLEKTADTYANIRIVLIDFQDSEPYTLHLLPSAKGEYVSNIKELYTKKLQEIADTCFIFDTFYESKTQEVIKLIKEKYNDFPQYIFKGYPNFAVFKRESGKWYGIIMSIEVKTLLKVKGLSATITDKLLRYPRKTIEIINLHINKTALIELLNKTNYLPAYHMNKKSWVSIILDSDLEIGSFLPDLEVSYSLALK